jgi:hypothetical protein
MRQQGKKAQTIFPDFPRSEKIVSPQGELTRTWHLSLASLYQALQANFSNEGIQLPQLTPSQLDTIEAIYTPLVGTVLTGRVPNISGTIVYDSYNNVPKVFIITFADPGNPASAVQSASWKTFTIT